MFHILTFRFLPYTVQFEVGPQEDYSDHEVEANFNPAKNSTLGIPVSSISNSILPSLSVTNSQQHTPSGGSPPVYLERPGRLSFHESRSSFTQKQDSASTNGDSTPEQFFYHHNKLRKPSGSTDAVPMSSENHTFADNLNEKLSPHYIQPRSRFNNGPVPSLVVDAKKLDNDIGLSGLKINRSSTNLTGLGSATNSYTNLLNINQNPGSAKLRSVLARTNQTGFFLNNNGSSNSLPIPEEEEEEQKFAIEETPVPVGNKSQEAEDPDYWKNNFNNMLHGRTDSKLTPFGGFSRPMAEGSSFLDQKNIFESAPWKVVLTDKGNASLTKAVGLSVQSSVIKKRKWVGTLSMPSDVVPGNVIQDIAQELKEEYNSYVVFPNDMTFQGHYKSFCKQILWPTLHYQIPDDPKSKAFEDHSWEHYKLLNQLVADKVVEVYNQENKDLDPHDPENVIWIHDYHLLLVPRMVREKLPDAKIGFFLHVSFPSSEVFRCFAQRKALLRGILGANSIAFQTKEYVRHFLQTCNRLLLADTNEFGVTYDGNCTTISTNPVGVDAASVHEVLVSNEVQDWRNLIRERWCDQHLIVSRDKLDKLRGIKQKLLAYESFLHDHPEFVDNTVFIQICIASSQDHEYEQEVMQIVARINSLSSNISGSQPVVFLQKDIEFDQYLALQCEADVFVVSSMREGLNLTCHEFILATSEKKSPLMLSEFTGSSQLLSCDGEGALLINPWDIKAFGETFYQALTMSPEEKLKRWTNCHKRVVTHDSKHWVLTCIYDINEAWNLEQGRSSCSLKPFTKKVFEDFYRGTDSHGKRLFFLNLETPNAITSNNKSDITKVAAGVSDPTKSSFSVPIKISTLLHGLLSDRRNQVYIISYLRRTDLATLFKKIPNLGLIAENGGYIKLIGSNNWISIVDEAEIKNWLPQVTQLIEAKAERLPGSHCEVEDCTVRFHAGSSIKDDRERSLDAMGDTIQHVNDMFHDKEGVHATLIKDVVVVQQNQLALKALKFIISFYNQDKAVEHASKLVEEFQAKLLPESAPSTPITESADEGIIPIKSPISSPLSLATFSPPTPQNPSQNKVQSVFFSGGSTPIDEPSFDYLENLSGIDKVVTITVLGPDTDFKTSAKYSVAGKNELLGILSIE